MSDMYINFIASHTYQFYVGNKMTILTHAARTDAPARHMLNLVDGTFTRTGPIRDAIDDFVMRNIVGY